MARARHRRGVRGGAIDRGGVGMRAALYNGPHSIEVGERPDPVVNAPTDAVVRVVLSCVCGSDLWYWRGESPHDLGPIGHEFIGVVEEVGPEVRGIAQGEVVIAPFIYCDGAVGLCGVIAAQRLGAARIIALSRNPTRQKVATAFGATEIVAERGDAAIEAVRELTNNVGVDAALECVGTGQSVATALAITS